MRAGKKRRVEIRDDWWCETCKETDPRTRVDMLAHLMLVHRLEKPIRGQRKQMAHFDMADRYLSAYVWEIGDVAVRQQVTGPR